MRQLTDSSVHSSLVFEVNGKVVTDSLVIAKILKNHLDVLKEVRKQIVYVGEEFGGENFHESTYVNSKNRRISKYDLTEEAFTLLVMGYTSREAVGMKIKFMKEFKRMKQYIQNQQNVPKDPMGVLKLTFAR